MSYDESTEEFEETGDEKVDAFIARFKAISNEDDGDEYLKDERIRPDRRLHRRPDVNAILLLDKLAGDKAALDRDAICSAAHDQFWLDVDPAAICETATDEDIRDLIRCGVSIEGDGFYMFA